MKSMNVSSSTTVPMMMFGGSPTSVAVPPMFEASTSTMRKGIGSSSSIWAMTSVTGNIRSTVVTLSRKADSTAVMAAR